VNANDASWFERFVRQSFPTASAQWPGIGIDEEAFVSAALQRVADGLTREQLEALHVVDLYLAVGCAARDRAALAHFERSILPAVAPSIQRVAGASHDDVTQAVRTKLFVGKDGHTGAIGLYRGTGSLLSWVRATAVRTALDSVRSDQPSEPIEALERAAMPGPGDPELDVIRSQRREELQASLREGFAALTADERNLLRWSVVDGLPLASIGTMLTVHESTVSRWVAAARQRLMELTRANLVKRLNLSENDLESLLGVAHSQLDLSVSRLFREK
jgi:RNA polymerase sigma-70 factor (ECF subfamily)